MLNLFRYELFSRWRAILGWGIGLALFAALYIAVYPEMMADLGGLADLSIYRLFGIDLGSFAGFIASVVVQIMPLFLGVYVIILGTGILAGEEDNGTLELVLAMPITRWQIVTMKTAAAALVLLAILGITAAGSALTLAIVAQTVTVDATPLQLFIALIAAWPLMLAVLAMGLFFGTVTPNRRAAVTFMAIIYVLSYLTNSIAGLAESLEPFQYISLFGYLDSTASVFTDGVNPANGLVLLAIAAGFFLLALLSFNRRNITVGQWPWQRGRVPSRA